MVVHASRTSFTHMRTEGLDDNRLRARRCAQNGARAGDVPNGSKAHVFALNLFARKGWREGRHRHHQPTSLNDVSFVGVVNGGQLDVLSCNVLPDIQFGPVGDRKDPEVFLRVQLGVEQGPKLGPLRLGLPSPKAVSVREDAFFGSRLFFVSSGATNERIELEFFDRLQKGHRLMHVSGLIGA